MKQDSLTLFDSDFEQVENLKWLPWIGNEYINLNPNRKLLLIGESHYAIGEDELSLKKDIERQEPPGFTRKVINEMAIEQNYYATKIFQNTHKLILGERFKDPEKFWERVSFCNLIQRPMECLIKKDKITQKNKIIKRERPSRRDYRLAWDVFVDLIKIMEPDLCIVLTTSAADYFNNIVNKRRLKFEPVKRHKKIGGAYEKSASLVINDKNIKLLFVRHPSSYFSASKWRNFLQNNIPDYLNWVEEL